MTDLQTNTSLDTLHTDADDTDDGIISIRCGHGANCSSIGSAVEMLFLSATVGAAILAAVAAALSPDAEASESALSTASVDVEESQSPEK